VAWMDADAGSEGFLRFLVDDLLPRQIGPGTSVRTLWGEPGGVRALAVDWEPGAQWPGLDVHEPGPEVVYVVDGELIDGDTVLRPGEAAVYPAGSSHSPRSETGCRLLVFYPEG
jgi:uncharacterized cupin superfamily protein